MEPVIYALLLTTLAGLSTGIGALLGIINKKPRQKQISFIMAFSAGVMVFLSFMEMLTEAKEELGMGPTLIWLTVGIVVVFLIDMLLPEHENVHDHLFDDNLMKKNGGKKDTNEKSTDKTDKITPAAIKYPRHHRKNHMGPMHGRGKRNFGAEWRGSPSGRGMGYGKGHHRQFNTNIQLKPQEVIDDDKCEEMFCIDNPKMLKLGILSMLGLFIHNLPEGLATFSASLLNPTLGLQIALAIMLHNIPEGICIAVPIYIATNNRKKAFWYAFISGMAEPVGALLAWVFLYNIITPEILMSLLAFVAGIMIYISVDTLIPTAKNIGYKHTMVIGFSAGMILMGISLIFLA